VDFPQDSGAAVCPERAARVERVRAMADYTGGHDLVESTWPLDYSMAICSAADAHIDPGRAHGRRSSTSPPRLA
jgi:hypothetical protein